MVNGIDLYSRMLRLNKPTNGAFAWYLLQGSNEPVEWYRHRS